MSKITELLNARHEDLDFELGMLVNNKQLAKAGVVETLGLQSEVGVLVEKMQERLIDKLGVDLEEVAEDEEIEVSEIDDKLVEYALSEAFNQAKIEMKSYLQLDNMVVQIKNLGGTDEEVEGLQSFKKRLEKTVFDRYDVTEEDLKEDSDE